MGQRWPGPAILATTMSRERKASDPTDDLVGDSGAIDALRAQIRRLATFDAPGTPNVPTVLLQGETGTGKGLVARVLHASGGRARASFVDVNCAAIPDTMLEAELFGFEAGAFTDAKRAKPGLFEAASGGTLFLDEIDALPLALQGKLLKAIEEKTVRRLGAVSAHRVDVKLVAATQRQLRDLVAAGAFRADLYHRLAVVVLDVPPLRERGDDVVLLAEHFLAQHAAAYGLAVKRLDDAARAWLAGQPWPGNVRELAHLMERATLLGADGIIDVATLEALRVPAAASTIAAPATADQDDEPARIRGALARSGGNVVRAARLLGIGRNALRNRMRRYGIARPALDGDAAVPAPEAAAPEPETQPTWEQRPVAVLAIDLVVPESAVEPWTTARRWEQMIADCVAGFGGVFVARSPSHLTAAFGIPRALEQLPQRAVQAALAIQRRLAEADARPELRMAVHVGALRFAARATGPGSDVLPLGDTIALPERLLGHAGAGEILVSAAVGRRVEATCELRPRDLRFGETDAVRAWLVVGAKPRADASEEPAAARFVGRERELALLRESFDSAAGGHGLVVFLLGEAGIGKSRLLAELRRRIAAEPHLWVEGRCASYGSTTAFLPILDGLRRFFAIDDRDDDAGMAAKIERGICALGGDLAWTIPFVRQMLGVAAGDASVASLDSASRRSETFRAFKAILRAAAAQLPLVLVVEDLHWIDAASEEYLAFIADTIPTTRALLVCSHRPGYRHPFGDRSYHVRIALRPLSAAEMADLSGSLLGTTDVPAEVRTLIAAKAEGNPFFVEEVTRSLLEDGTLRRENGHVVLTRAVGTIDVPDTIQDVLVARLDRLADDARHAIQVASVIGREFALRLLERIAKAGGRVRAQVDELRALELIYEKATHPELAYMFKHALTHDVAYSSVLVERRRELHRTIGAAIEELYVDRLAEFYETLAHHYGRAEEWERALEYHTRAADKAADNFANRAVIAHCREALAIADRLGDRVPAERRQGLEERLGLAHFYASEYAAGGAAFERAAAVSADHGRRALDLGHSWLNHIWGHAYDAAARVNETLYELARREGLPLADALTRTNEGFTRGVCAGDLAAEERLLGEALALAERAGDEATVATTRFYLAQVAEWTGDYRRAIAISEQTIAAGRRLRLAHLVVWPGWFLGKAACCLADYGRAVAQLTEAYEMCDRIGDRAWKSRLLNTLGWCFTEIGSHARARDFNERAAVLAHELGDPEIVSNSEINLAVNALALGDVQRAAGYLDPIRAALARPGDPWMRWRYALHALDATARVALVERAPEHALALAEEEAAGARRHRVPKVEARALVLRADALAMLERRDEAEVALTGALDLAETIAYPRGAWQALGGLTDLARRAGRAADAARHAARRRDVVAAAARSLDVPDLRRDLEAATGA